MRGSAARRAPEEPPVPAPAPLRWRGQIAAKRFEVQITAFPSGSELILTQSKQHGLGWRQELGRGCRARRGAAGRGTQPSTALCPSPRGCTEGTGTEVHGALRTSLAARRELSQGGMRRGGRLWRLEERHELLQKPGPGVWGPRCTPTANAPAGTAATGRAGCSPAAPWDALPCPWLRHFPSSCPGAAGMRGSPGQPPLGFPPSPTVSGKF